MSHALRVVMIAPFGIRPKGTLLARMLPLATALARRGHRLAIVAPPLQNPEDAGTTVVHAGVPVTHAPLPRLPGPAAAPEQAAALLRLALAEGPDLLHLFKPKGYGGLAALAARLARGAARPPLVVDADDWEGPGGWNDLLPYPPYAKALFAWQERDLPRRAAAVTVASRTLESLVWAMGVPPGRVFYLPNGVERGPEARRPGDPETRRPGDPETRRPGDPEARRPGGPEARRPGGPEARRPGDPETRRPGDPETRRPGDPETRRPGGPEARRLGGPALLLYTRFWELDLAELAAALAAIHAARPHARLIVVGRGEHGEERELLAMAARAGFAPMVDYRGWLDPAAIPAALAEASLALAPARDTLVNRARCSAKLLELMGAGLAVVASDVGEARSFVAHEASGLLVPPGDPAALAAAAMRLLDDEALRARLAAGARAAAARFSWDNLAPAAERAYELALGAARGR